MAGERLYFHKFYFDKIGLAVSTGKKLNQEHRPIKRSIQEITVFSCILSSYSYDVMEYNLPTSSAFLLFFFLFFLLITLHQSRAGTAHTETNLDIRAIWRPDWNKLLPEQHRSQLDVLVSANSSKAAVGIDWLHKYGSTKSHYGRWIWRLRIYDSTDAW